jgi:hypothetical protein
VISLFGDEQDFVITVYSDSDWTSSQAVVVEVTRDGVREGDEGAQLPRMKWADAYRAFAELLGVNEHQLAAMAKGLDRGSTLRFNLSCRRSELSAVGFLPHVA